MEEVLRGPRCEIGFESSDYPEALCRLQNPPKRLYVIGDPGALQEGLAVIGARKATPYGKSAAYHFAKIAAQNGVVIISGGALGCDSAAHRGALDAGGKTVVFLGGGADRLYPVKNIPLFQEIVSAGGAVVSERSWDFPPTRYTFRERNRLIAALAKATLIAEAGLPSGTFSTADAALVANRDVLVVPGAITSAYSKGANRLLYQGAIPVVDDESFEDVLLSLFGILVMHGKKSTKVGDSGKKQLSGEKKKVYEALCAEQLSASELCSVLELPQDHCSNVSVILCDLINDGLVVQYRQGRFGVVVSQ